MQFSAGIEGLPGVNAGLEEMKTATAKGVLRRTGIAALSPFDAAWRPRVGHLSGALAQSGGVGTKLSGRQAAIARAEKVDEVEVYAGPGPLAQATQDEFGNAHQPPRGGVRSAWETTRHQVLDGVADGLADAVNKTAERAARRAAGRALRGSAA